MARPRNDPPSRFTCEDCKPGRWCDRHRREERVYKRELRTRQNPGRAPAAYLQCHWCMKTGHSPDFCPFMESMGL